MKQTYKEQNKQLFNDFMYRHYFKYWEPGIEMPRGYHTDLELYPTSKCNLKCSYCYLKNFDKETFYDTESQKKVNVLKNVSKIYQWLLDKNWMPGRIEIFSGELFIHPWWKEYLDLLYNFFKATDRKPCNVIIPTNATFCLSEDHMNDVLEYVNKFRNDFGIRFSLSLSVDGKPVDSFSRPFKNKNTEYTDDFYDRLMRFAMASGSHFHPMLSANNVHHWIDNFHWWVETLVKYGLTPLQAVKRIYILETRNPNWNDSDLMALVQFIQVVGTYVFKHFYKSSPNEYLSSFLRTGSFNFFGSGFGTVARGLGCNLQSAVTVRGDNKLIVCHRLGYKNYEGASLVTDDRTVIDIEPINPMFYMTAKTFDFRTGYMCDSCPIRYICNHYCMGVNFEASGDAFLPVPTVCKMELVKHKALIDLYDSLGILEVIMAKFSSSAYVNKRMIGCYRYLLDQESYFK